MTTITRWVATAVGAPLERVTEPAPRPDPGKVLVEVAGCGVCHTDIGFWADGVPTRAPMPLALGHEVAGFVVDVGEGAEELLGKAVVVPAVLPCGRCAACAAGQGGVCRAQFMPGNDGHGGFATHVLVPALGLCEVPGAETADQPLGKAGVTLRHLSVLADAASTAWQGVLRTELADGGAAVVVGSGGVGSFVLQLARARGAKVVALDTNEQRRATALELGADVVIDASQPVRDVRKAVKAALRELGAPSFGVRVYECSGNPAGQELAFQLLGAAGVLAVIGYSAERVSLHLSRLMALDARAIGTWGCDPKHYPGLLQMVLDGVVAVRPLVEEHPLERINDLLEAIRRHEVNRRVILVPST